MRAVASADVSLNQRSQRSSSLTWWSITRARSRIDFKTSPIAPSCAQALVSSTISRSRSARSAGFTCSASDSILLWGSSHLRPGGVACALTIRTCLPSASRIPAMPSSLPRASQSGRMWLVSTTRWDCRRISRRLAQSSRMWFPFRGSVMRGGCRSDDCRIGTWAASKGNHRFVRRRSRDLSGAGRVRGQLCLESLHRFKAVSVTQPVEEVNVERHAVEWA